MVFFSLRISLRGLATLVLYATYAAADLTSDLSGLNFTVLTPGSSGYSSASAACAYRSNTMLVDNG